MLESDSNHTPALSSTVTSPYSLPRLKGRVRNRARSLTKGENLQHSDRCFVCGNLADAVRRRGSRYSPVCWDCLETKRQPEEQHFAERLEKLVRSGSSEEAGLVSDILIELTNEVGVFADDPRVVRSFLLAVLDEMRKPADRESRGQRRATDMLKQISEVLNGCSKRRLSEIDQLYNPDDEPTGRDDEPETVISEGCGQKLEILREQLNELAPLPENEAVCFQLQTEIFRLEREGDLIADEWPDMIGGAQ